MKKRFHYKKKSTSRYHYTPKLFTLHLDVFFLIMFFFASHPYQLKTLIIPQSYTLFFSYITPILD